MLAEVLAIACLAAMTAVPVSAAPWTLERTIEAVRLTDPAIQAAHEAGAAGRAEAGQAWAMLLPHVNASAGFTRTDDPAMIFSQKLWQGRFTAADFAIDKLNQPGETNAFQVGITVDQPLWNGGREFTAPGLAGHGARAATAMEQAEVGGRLLAAVETYTRALQARENARAAGQALAAARAMRSASIERFARGQVAELDTLRAAAREGDARVRALGATRGLAVALDQLSRLVQAPVAADDLEIPPDPPALPDSVSGERGEVTAAREAAEAAATRARTARLRLLPSLNSRLAVTQYTPWDDRSYERRWMLGVFADFPIFDGAQRWEESRQARARAAEARARVTAIERDLAVGLAAARAEDAVSRERRDAAHAGRTAAEEALRLATERYRAGLLPLSELLAADAEATAARASDVEASTAVVLAHHRLLHAMGGLR